MLLLQSPLLLPSLILNMVQHLLFDLWVIMVQVVVGQIIVGVIVTGIIVLHFPVVVIKISLRKVIWQILFHNFIQ